MGTKDNQVIPVAWQLPIEINGNLVTLININLKTIILKLLGRLMDESLVWLKAIKLVNDSCLEGIC